AVPPAPKTPPTTTQSPLLSPARQPTASANPTVLIPFYSPDPVYAYLEAIGIGIALIIAVGLASLFWLRRRNQHMQTNPAPVTL
ncbi:MAG TPA: hypothetical protein VMD05_09480, partial [Candidatus Nanoarchaeia archaeon]|nr:hypothetical protein [Candidatus Nanoarchaeia archaeon]